MLRNLSSSTTRRRRRDSVRGQREAAGSRKRRTRGSTGCWDVGTRCSVHTTQIGRETRPKPKSGRRTSDRGNRRENTSTKTSNVDVDYSKSLKNLKWPVTSVTISSLNASTQYSLEAAFYTQNFCCVVNPPRGPPKGGGLKIIFKRNM